MAEAGETISRAQPWEIAGAPATGAAARSFIRGSTLLLFGRALSLGLNFGAQVLIVRYLTKSDYGAFAYALSITSMAAVLVTLGLHKAVPRFLPIYRERGDTRNMFGAIALAGLTVVGLGISLILVLHGLQGTLLGRAIDDPLPLSLLLVLILLTPVEALDHLLQGLLATFAGARAVFFRRHVLAPLLRVAAVVLVLATAGDVYLLAYAYVASGVIGVLAYSGILLRTWSRQGLLDKLRSDGLELPARQIFGYSMPLLTSEMMSVVKGSFVVVLLGLLSNTTAVAEFRAILPVAKVNLVVFSSFSLLFIPVASSLFAKGDKASIHDLFWQTSTWTAVLSFPLLALTTTLAQPLTVLLFGERYASSADLLSVLAIGFYFNAALGANTATLRVFGRVRYLVATDVIVGLLAVGMHLLLIPPYGAMGAAVAAATTLVVHNVLHHVGLSMGDTGVRLFEPAYVRIYGGIAVTLAALMALDRLASPPLYLTIALTLAASLAVLRIARPVLRAETTFPELRRAKWVRRFL